MKSFGERTPCRDARRHDNRAAKGAGFKDITADHLFSVAQPWTGSSRFHIMNGTNSVQLLGCLNKKHSGRHVHVHVGPRGMP